MGVLSRAVYKCATKHGSCKGARLPQRHRRFPLQGPDFSYNPWAIQLCQKRQVATRALPTRKGEVPSPVDPEFDRQMALLGLKPAPTKWSWCAANLTPC